MISFKSIHGAISRQVQLLKVHVLLGQSIIGKKMFIVILRNELLLPLISRVSRKIPNNMT